MAWRIIQQPDGLFARFSTIVDMFTDYDMTYDEAIEICISEYDMGPKAAQRKVQTAIDERRTRWIESLNTIRAIHGQEKRQLCVDVICRKQHEKAELL